MDKEFIDALSNYWFVEARDARSGELLSQYISNPRSRISKDAFKRLLADAILTKRFSPEEYEALTGVDLESREEVASDLEDLWRATFNGDPIVLPQART